MPARIEVTIKLDELPKQTVKVMGNGQMFIVGEAPGPRFVVTLNKKSLKRLMVGAEQWPLWLAVISGKFGECVAEGIFRLEHASVLSVIERKPRPEASQEHAPKEDGDTPEGQGAPDETPNALGPAPKTQPAQPAQPPIPKAWLASASKPHARPPKQKPQPLPAPQVPKWRVSKEQRLLARNAVPEVMVRRPGTGSGSSG